MTITSSRFCRLQRRAAATERFSWEYALPLEVHTGPVSQCFVRYHYVEKYGFVNSLACTIMLRLRTSTPDLAPPAKIAGYRGGILLSFTPCFLWRLLGPWDKHVFRFRLFELRSRFNWGTGIRSFRALDGKLVAWASKQVRSNSSRWVRHFCGRI